jgi:hypothetical protein
MKRPLFLWILVVSLAGCVASQPSRIALPASPLDKPPEAGMATVYFYNDSGPTLIPGKLTVADETGTIASISRHTFTVRKMPVGEHALNLGEQTLGMSGRMLTIDIKPGETYNIVVAYSPIKSHIFPFTGDPLSIKELDPDTAKQLRTEMAYQS